MKSRVAFIGALALASLTGCPGSPTVPSDAWSPPVDTGVDAPPDCHAVCIRTTQTPCMCDFPCAGHYTTATCDATHCQCTVDGTATLSYDYTICGPEQFIPGCHPELSPDAGSDGGAPVDASTAATYTTETRMVMSGGVMRTYLLAMPTDLASRGSLPLVFSFHGDGGTAAGMRTSLPLESTFQPDRGAVFVYPESVDTAFEYWTYDGRTREVTLVTDLIAALHTELDIDTSKVFVVGFSGGATMANAIGCRLGPTVIRALGLHSGTLYSTDGPSGPEFTYTANGGVSCTLPDALFVWGEADMESGVAFSDGVGVRDNYLATNACGTTTTTSPIAPCQSYDGCTHDVVWCPIPGMGHAIWPNAAQAMGDFFESFP